MSTTKSILGTSIGIPGSSTMTRSIAQSSKFIGIGLLFSLGICVVLRAQTTTPPSVTLSPGANIQAAVTAAPAGTTFVLLAGVYRMQRVQPKDGDVFTGQGSVILNGSEILAFQLLPEAASGSRTQPSLLPFPEAVKRRIRCAGTRRISSSIMFCRYQQAVLRA